MSSVPRTFPGSALLRAAAGGALILAVAACGASSATTPPAAHPGGATYSLMQMNLCLSGLAGCYDKVQYPAAVVEAVARIDDAHPDAVTINEACSGDAIRIARRTMYHLRFSSVIYAGKPLPCAHPGGRGLFGDAVLTRAAITSTRSQPFTAQAGPERRVWLCVRTRVAVEVCTAHLASHETAEVAANAPQCAELAVILPSHLASRIVIFGGDVNRHRSCAPRGFWSRSDVSSHQDPGSQQVYGNGALRAPSAQVVPARHTDHDILLVHARRPEHP